MNSINLLDDADEFLRPKTPHIDKNCSGALVTAEYLVKRWIETGRKASHANALHLNFFKPSSKNADYIYPPETQIVTLSELEKELKLIKSYNEILGRN